MSVVVPTVGRPSLQRLLGVLTNATGPPPTEVIVVDDRSEGPDGSLSLPSAPFPIRLLSSGGHGPAAARNVGWRAARGHWIAFLDDDVVVADSWFADLRADIENAVSRSTDDVPVGATSARIVVPLPNGRRPDDDERRTATLENARWITADMAYLRSALHVVGGFDERFPRAYREDADLALRVTRTGHRIVSGTRVTTHPASSGAFLESVRAQAGNADNALMRHKFGRGWRRAVGEGPGRMGRHCAATASAITTISAAVLGRRNVAAVGALAWAFTTAEFACRRIAPGPRTRREIARMVATSALIPPAACMWRIRGEWSVRGSHRSRPAAVLFDRDDTIIVDIPYLADPDQVRPVPGAVETLGNLRAQGVPIGIVSNQSGVAKGLIAPEALAAVNARVEELFGPIDTWQVCTHDDVDGCECRKPLPAMVRRAADELAVDVRRCVVIGDTGSDVQAALAAGARAVLVPTRRTLPSEVASARLAASVSPTLVAAVGSVLGVRP
ncbi:HAD-IIIA family hydrolase [Rhodococcus sp. NPDC058521]|uniref:HAD-IIIA family hydrolase n=1 Tax=Rhodococcus sp. NPDC058521 TaxID=3346536 RepID=UPI0036517895